MNKKNLSFFLAILLAMTTQAQADRWQQRVEYEMEIDVDATNNRLEGEQKLTYYNNSPDELKRVFYHLYFNAFQPNTMMDVRSRTIADPDPRVKDRIFNLKPNEIGYQKIKSLTQDGQPCQFEIVETILEVALDHPIPPNGKSVFELKFEAQVPLLVRRAGRDSREGVRLSMAQWYPKMCEYDYQGWHANPYVGREFYGVWGDFDVKIKLDKSYIVAATGILQNPEEIGYSYEAAGQKVQQAKSKKLTWHFKANNVHDFVWAADPDYKHTQVQVPDGPTLHFFYQNDNKTDAWQELPPYAVKLFQLASQYFGKYPYETYSVIQGGDGGMEYPLATLVTGNRSLRSLVGVVVHEVMHSWYQMILGTNESLYAWMDEGFTSYASDRIMAELFEPNPDGIHSGSYMGYFSLVKSGLEEPLSTHADHFFTNRAYGTAAYSKGAVFLNQLEYVVGKKVFEEALLEYFNTWKFKHPNVNDFIRIFEKKSDLELDWYKEYFVYSIKTIDYAVAKVAENSDTAFVTLERLGLMPMPTDVWVTYTNGTSEIFYAPLQIMRGGKAQENNISTTLLPDWAWTHPTYTFSIPKKGRSIAKIHIDPTQRMADLNPDNNFWQPVQIKQEIQSAPDMNERQ